MRYKFYMPKPGHDCVFCGISREKYKDDFDDEWGETAPFCSINCEEEYRQEDYYAAGDHYRDAMKDENEDWRDY